VLARLQAIVGGATHSADVHALMRDALAHRTGRVDPVSARALLPPDADSALLLDFVAESRELLEQADLAYEALAHAPEDAEAINAVFRTLHTLKGTSAFLALDCVTEFAHHAESLLSRVRDGELRCVGETAALVLRSLDMLRALLDAIQGAIDGHGDVLPDGYGHLLAALRDSDLSPDADAHAASSAASPAHGAPHPTAGRESAAALVDVLRRLPDRAAPRRAANDRAADATVRVRADALHRLIELVGDLVVAASMVAQHPHLRQDPSGDLQQHVTGAGRLVRELQHVAMAMQMVPLQPQVQKIERLVRDLALRGGKRIEFVAEVELAEIDRHVAERLGDPLLHMVRNAVDHGIECPAERLAAGKPECGTIHLRAWRADGDVVLELRDDGRGLDRERIVRRALQQGYLTTTEGLADAEVHALIFRPGFSTADRVTDVSGRGVGMDVVQRNIEALHGRVDVCSQPGQGTTLRVQLPLASAVTDALLVHVGGEPCLIPSCAGPVAIRPSRAALFTVPSVGEVVRWHDELLPVVRLQHVLGLEPVGRRLGEPLLVLVGQTLPRIALLVDEALGQQQVVSRPRAGAVPAVPGVSGEAFLSDGRVGLMLDVGALSDLARAGDQGALRAPSARDVG